jgi:hypothetical protein
MNYENYEGKIVERFAVALKGWPVDPIRNPSSIHTRTDLDHLAHALTTGSCLWVLLTDDELAARMEDNQKRAKQGVRVYKPRKSQKKAPKASSSADVIEDSDADE